MLNYMYILTCMCTLAINVSGSPWASLDQEKLDEARDAEIYEAVVTSMNEWHRRHDRIHYRVKREELSVCYDRLGCFETTGPFSYLDMLPASPEEINTKFLLYPGHSKRRSGNPPGEVPFYNLTDAFTWAKQGFNNTLPTKVVIHGFGSDCSHIWVYEMRSALLAVEEANVICVDWRDGALLPNYVKATANTRLVGKQLAMLLGGLVEEVGFSLRNMHLIGFSLGAHVAGFAGAELGNLSRITGLDPAGPLFESQDPRARLDQTDAYFVDVIHSNGENLILGGLGSWQPMGHVDFYPNGGRMQKGCSNIFVGAVSDIIWSSAVEGRSLCNHRRAYKFFTDSVSPRCHFPAFPCDSYDAFLAGKCFPCSDEKKCGNMGYYSDRSKGRGQLYLITRDEEPFCSHQYNIKIESSPSNVPIISYGKIQITLIGDSLLNETFTLTRKEDEEMKLGASVSRIIVPHPILLEPTKIQILYTAYSGWLTSGLLQWRIDKITLSDSFGRSSSVCKKNLILDSGVPVILPLYPGECNLPKGSESDGDSVSAEDRIDEKTKNFTFETPKSKFVPTPVIKMGSEGPVSEEDKDKNSLQDAFDIFNIPWNNDNNILDAESEQSRAFNTRVVKMTNSNDNSTEELNKSGGKEVVEPILRPQSVKRTRDPKQQKTEITEPILGPTTAKNSVPNILSKLTNNQELVYNFYDVDKDSDWVPSVNPTLKSKEQKWKRQDASKSFSTYHDKEEDAFNAIVKTVQILPIRLARMFEEAEKYARETILPFVSNYTPKFLTDFITPRDVVTPKYLPLRFEENTEKYTRTTAKLLKKDKQNTEKTRAFDHPPILDFEKESTTQSLTTTQYSNIQKIGKKGEKVSLIFAESMETTTTFWEIPIAEETGRKLGTTAAPKDFVLQKTLTVPTENFTEPDVKTSDEIGKKGKGIYINLPVFDENYKEVKYIPLVRDESKPEKT